jgi:hypothetical protein
MTDIAVPTPANPRPPRRLTRREASVYLLEAHGLAVSAGTLARKASTGGGPRYARMGAVTVYTLADLDAWAPTQITPTVATAAELKR